MPRRSTRMKLQYQVDKILTAFKRIYEHIQFFEELADDRSDYINTYLPVLIKATMELEQAFRRFREGL